MHLTLPEFIETYRSALEGSFNNGKLDVLTKLLSMLGVDPTPNDFESFVKNNCDICSSHLPGGQKLRVIWEDAYNRYMILRRDLERSPDLPIDQVLQNSLAFYPLHIMQVNRLIGAGFIDRERVEKAVKTGDTKLPSAVSKFISSQTNKEKIEAVYAALP